MYDVADEHIAGLIAGLIALPLAWIFVGRKTADPATKLAAALMLLSGLIHLALVPSHLPDEGLTALLFVVDGVGFLVLARAAFHSSWWRSAAAWWLGATILAYLIWVLAGWETPDQVGVLCKLDEVVALGLVMRRPVVLSLATGATVIGIWIGGLAHPDALHAHAGAVLQPVSAEATTGQKLATNRLLVDTRQAIAPYRDPALALAAGFKPGPASDADMLEHWANPANKNAILDPSRPQDLVYARTPQGLILIGAMFQMPTVGQWGPDPGGPLTQWHQHEGICFTPFGFEFNFATPLWTCPIGAVSVTTPPMLHVWLIDNPKGGPFAAELDPMVRKELGLR
jgi:hypothetical protein